MKFEKSCEIIVGTTAHKLRSLVQRIERLEEEKAAIAEDIKQVYAEAKGMGFNTKVLRKVIALRKRDQLELEEEQALLDLYMRSLGPTPLEEYVARQGENGDGSQTTITITTDDGPGVSMTPDELQAGAGGIGDQQ